MKIAVVCLVSLVVAVGLVHSLPVNPSSPQEGGSQGGDALVRDKRTVGFLRDLFPNFSQMIDRKIQMLTRLVFRVIGRLVLQGGGGGGGGGGSDTEERRISITLPTYPPSAEDEDEEDEDETEAPALPDSDSAASDLTTTIKTVEADEDNSVAESQVNLVRVKREEDGESDLNVEATGDNNEVSDAEGESEEEEDEDARNKRFLNFNLGGTAGASSGGSGNFLFDIIRLVAGSGSTQETDESSNAAIEEAKDESSYGFGVPGPLTRLFVIANRGVASLIQDLILRLAQTSERIVNFKARLITSII